MAGRPRKYKNAAELQKVIDEYFSSCYEDVPVKNEKGEEIGTQKRLIRPFTITGLALAVDMSREGLLNYEETEEFFDTIKKAKLRIHNFAEEQLFTSRNPAGVIFNLKNNYGWKDKTEQDLNMSGELEINVNITED
jgi:hypothetical protein